MWVIRQDKAFRIVSYGGKESKVLEQEVRQLFLQVKLIRLKDNILAVWDDELLKTIVDSKLVPVTNVRERKELKKIQMYYENIQNKNYFVQK